MIIDPKTSQVVAQIAQHLKMGELVAIPTETVYGLAADASNPEAVAKIFAFKKRPMNNPLIVHIADINQLSQWTSAVPDYAMRLASTFWPGSLTLILPKAEWVPDIVTAGQDSVGLRIPSHPVALAILKAFDGGLAAPSANPFTHISPTAAQHVAAYFDESLWIVEGGAAEVGLESTIIDCTGAQPVLLRQGMITAQEIFEKTHIQVVLKDQHVHTLHPGQALKHYSPCTPLMLLTSDRLAEKLHTEELSKIGLLYFSDYDTVTTLKALKLPQEAKPYAKQLYAALHDLDRAGCAEIWVELPPHDEKWAAIHERLSKAAIKDV